MATKPFPKRKREEDIKRLVKSWVQTAEDLIADDKRPFGTSDGGMEWVQEGLGIKNPDEDDDAITQDFCDELDDYTNELLSKIPKYILAKVK